MTWLKETDVTASVPKMSFAELLTVKFDTLSEPLEAWRPLIDGEPPLTMVLGPEPLIVTS
jgi:hypothetical protein